MSAEPPPSHDLHRIPFKKRLRAWLATLAPFLWTPNGHDWYPTSWYSFGALVALIVVVGVLLSL